MNVQDFDEAPAARLNCLKSEDEGRCATYELIEEDHTLGNALRHMILKNPEVKFCGYALPHPNERKINLQIQVYTGKAIDALVRGFEDLKTLNSIIKETILAEKKRVGSADLEDLEEDEVEYIVPDACQRVIATEEQAEDVDMQ